MNREVRTFSSKLNSSHTEEEVEMTESEVRDLIRSTLKEMKSNQDMDDMYKKYNELEKAIKDIKENMNGYKRPDERDNKKEDDKDYQENKSNSFVDGSSVFIDNSKDDLSSFGGSI